MSTEVEREAANAKRADELRRIPYEEPDPGSWPKHVRQIGLGELNNLGIDSLQNIYWNGRLIEVRQPLSLTFWQRVGAVTLAVAAAIGATSAAVSAYAALMALPTK